VVRSVPFERGVDCVCRIKSVIETLIEDAEEQLFVVL